MNEVNQKIIEAIIKKAEAVCPDSLALIGLYGSVATGDTHEKSDLDLLLLINDAQGYQLSEAFILDDTEIGYDLYCTTWAMLEADASCGHAQLSRLLDSPLVYAKEQHAVQRLESLRKKALDLLASDARYDKAQAAIDHAKQIYADCFLTDSVAKLRTAAGIAIHFLLDAVMLYHGRYFRKGLKRTFDELEGLNLSFDMKEQVMRVIQAESSAQIRSRLTDLMKEVQASLLFPHEKRAPRQDNLSGTYEEMVSNWRNKMQEASTRNDLFSSYMNMVSCQCMMDEIAENVAIKPLDMMGQFDPRDPEKNRLLFEHTLKSYLETYREAGMRPNCFANVNDFLASYLKRM